MANVTGDSSADGVAGVTGSSSSFNGVLGVTTANGHAGVAGVCDEGNGNGVYGRSHQANGILGFATGKASGVAGANDDGTGNGVYGRSKQNDGILGITTGDGHAGVAGVCDDANGNGVYGRSRQANGVLGFALGPAAGVAGANDEGTGNGVYGRSKHSDGVLGLSSSAEHSGVAGVNEGNGVGVYGKGGRLAGWFIGDVEVTGDIRLPNADCAEEFDVASSSLAEPGTVMVLKPGGLLEPSQVEYDTSVAGVVSGAGPYKPGIILDKKPSANARRPIALLGKVACKVDAAYAPIGVGDLLTTSMTPGHAMRASDRAMAVGAVIGKALEPLSVGQGLISVLVMLH